VVEANLSLAFNELKRWKGSQLGHELVKQRTYHADYFALAPVVGIMVHKSDTKMLRYKSDKVICRISSKDTV
jgi:hypothetical protein